MRTREYAVGCDAINPQAPPRVKFLNNTATRQKLYGKAFHYWTSSLFTSRQPRKGLFAVSLGSSCINLITCLLQCPILISLYHTLSFSKPSSILKHKLCISFCLSCAACKPDSCLPPAFLQLGCLNTPTLRQFCELLLQEHRSRWVREATVSTAFVVVTMPYTIIGTAIRKV